MDLQLIVKAFKIEGTVIDICPLGNGHINSTYKVSTVETASPDYVLQLINHNIFKNVPALSENTIRLTNHLRSKLQKNYSLTELDRRVLTVIYTKNEKSYYKDTEGNYWRIFLFIKDSKTIEILENGEQAKTMGYAFGQFQSLLIDLPSPPLHDILPDFHNTSKRIEAFKKTIAENSFGRLNEVQSEVDFLLSFETQMKSIVKKGEAGIIPLRIIHQDTKLSNILFDKNDQVLCIIDLDTVSFAYLCYDFGDAVRAGMNTGKEDDENLANISLNMKIFKAFANGYYQTSKEFITKAEVETLAFGAKLICYEQALRFLDDYLNGDQYYKTDKEKHNLIRARAQIEFFKDLLKNFDEMDTYVKNLYKEVI